MKKLKTKQLSKILDKFGWEIKTGDEQRLGSAADIYAEQRDLDVLYTMRIDDGNVSLKKPLTHVYVNGGKIFEGRFRNKKELKLLMKMLGYKKINKHI